MAGDARLKIDYTRVKPWYTQFLSENAAIKKLVVHLSTCPPCEEYLEAWALDFVKLLQKYEIFV